MPKQTIEIDVPDGYEIDEIMDQHIYLDDNMLENFEISLKKKQKDDLGMPNTESISEKFLIDYMKDPIVNDDTLKILQVILRACKELNPWQPIETAPKDRRILLLYQDGDVRIDWWHHESQQDNKIVAWTEIPEPPK